MTTDAHDNLNDKLLTPDDLVARLQVSKTTVYRLVEARQIPFFRVAGSLRFAHRDVQQYLLKNRVASINEQPYGSTKTT